MHDPNRTSGPLFDIRKFANRFEINYFTCDIIAILHGLLVWQSPRPGKILKHAAISQFRQEKCQILPKISINCI